MAEELMTEPSPGGEQPPKRTPANGQEVQPGATGTSDTEPEWTPEETAWFEKRSAAKTAEEIAATDAEAPTFDDAKRAWLEKQVAGGGEDGGEAPKGGTLPEHLEAELAQWEKTGGELPAPLQKLVEKRIGKLVGERDGHKNRADAAEAQVQTLTKELETRGNAAPARGLMDEKTFNTAVGTTKKFQTDARAYLSEYADEETTKRVEEHMQKNGMDRKGLQRALDEVSNWLADEVPQLRQRIQGFKQQETQVSAVVAKRFPTLGKAGTPEYAFAQDVLKFIPDIQTRTPAHQMAMGLYALGKMAYDHLSQVSEDGDVIAALRTTLKGVAIPANGGGKGPGKFFLPGKAPGKAPVGARAGSPLAAPRVDGRRAAEEQASESIRNKPTAENVTAALKAGFKMS